MRQGAHLEILDDALQRGVSAERPGGLVAEGGVGGPVGFGGELGWIRILGMDGGGGGVGLAEDGGGGEEEGGDDNTMVAEGGHLLGRRYLEFDINERYKGWRMISSDITLLPFSVGPPEKSTPSCPICTKTSPTLLRSSHNTRPRTGDPGTLGGIIPLFPLLLHTRRFISSTPPTLLFGTLRLSFRS